MIVDLRNPQEEQELERIQGACIRLHVMPPPAMYWTVAATLPPEHLLRAGVDEINRHEVVWEPILGPDGEPLRTVRGKTRKRIALLPDGSPRLRLVHRFDEEGGEEIGGVHTRAHSWVRNAYNIVTTQMCGLPSNTGGLYGAGGLYNKDTSALNKSSDTNALSLAQVGSWTGIIGNTSYGIVVGTGTGVESFEGTALGTKVANGTGAGQLSYAAQETTTGAYAALVWTATMIRYMNNNSGGAIVIGEVGNYAIVYLYDTTHYGMVARELLAVAVSVPNTAQLKVTCTIKSPTYPA